MPKWSNFIRDLGTSGPPTLQGIYNLGFALRSEIPALFAKYLRVDAAQTFTSPEKAQGRSNLGVTIGTDVQAFDAGLASIAGLTTVADRMLYTTGADVYAVSAVTAFARSFLDDADAATARATIALGNVDNTSDANKPVSTAQQTALNLKANLASPPLTGTPTAPTAAPGTSTTQIATTAFVAAAAAVSARGHIFGLTLSNNVTDVVNDIDIAAGDASSSDTVPVPLVLASAITKRLDAAWAVGSGNGGLDTGSIADTTYHVFLIRRPDTGVVDALFSTSPTAPTLPANYTQFRRIGSIIRAAGTILAFTQLGNRFFLASAATDLSSASAASNVLLALTVPSGLVVLPVMSVNHTANTSTTTSTLIGHGDLAAAQMPLTDYSGVVAFAAVANVSGSVRTNTSRQVRYSIVISSGTVLASLWKTWGWVDINL